LVIFSLDQVVIATCLLLNEVFIRCLDRSLWVCRMNSSTSAEMPRLDQTRPSRVGRYLE